jgi:hypothetical protein
MAGKLKSLIRLIYLQTETHVGLSTHVPLFAIVTAQYTGGDVWSQAPDYLEA